MKVAKPFLPPFVDKNIMYQRRTVSELGKVCFNKNCVKKESNRSGKRMMIE